MRKVVVTYRDPPDTFIQETVGRIGTAKPDAA